MENFTVYNLEFAKKKSHIYLFLLGLLFFFEMQNYWSIMVVRDWNSNQSSIRFNKQIQERRLDKI